MNWSILNALKGTGDGASFQPTPNTPASYLIDGALFDTKYPCQILGGCNGSPNGTDLRLIQLYAVCPNTPQSRSMYHLISHIFFRRCPPKIIPSIVEGIAVIMRCLMFVGWRRSVKSRANQPVNCRVMSPRVEREGSTGVSLAAPATPLLKYLPGFSASARICAVGVSSDAPKVRDTVIRRLRNCNPKLFGVINISHSADPLHGGQGRAVLDALLRPDLFTPLTAKYQGAMQ